MQACSPVCILGKEFLEYNLSGSGQIEKSLSWNTFIHESKNKLMSWQKFLWPRMWGYTWPGLTVKEYIKKNPRSIKKNPWSLVTAVLKVFLVDYDKFERILIKFAVSNYVGYYCWRQLSLNLIFTNLHFAFQFRVLNRFLSRRWSVIK